MWDMLSTTLATMQQNITASVLDAVASVANTKSEQTLSSSGIKSFRQTMRKCFYSLIQAGVATAHCPHTTCAEELAWAETVDALNRNDESQVSSRFQQLLDALVPFIIMPPPGDVTVSCQPPTFLSEVDCGQYPSAFTGVPRKVMSFKFECQRALEHMHFEKSYQLFPFPLPPLSGQQELRT